VSERLDPQPPRRIPLIVIAIVLGLEAMGLILVTVLLVVETLTSTAAGGIGAGLALAAVAGVIAVGLLLAARGVLRVAKWTRPAAVVWQLVQLFVGLQAAQGPGGRYDLAALLAIPAVVVIVLFFTPGVAAAMRRG
jgi:hypothetical protein